MDKTTRNVVLAAASLSGFIATFAASSIAVALEDIKDDLHMSAPMLAWIMLTYLCGAGAILMPASRMADIFGRMRVFLIGMVGFTVFSIASAFAPSGTALIVIRTLQGLAGSLVFATNIALVTLSQPPETRGRGLGILTFGIYAGVTTGPILGGLVVGHLGWRVLLLIAGGVGLIITALSIWRLRGVEWKQPRDTPFDRLGSITWILAFPAALLGLTLLPGLVGIILLTAGLIGLITFFWWENRAIDPILNVNLLRSNRVFAFSNAAAMINYAANYAMITMITMYLEFNRGLEPQHAGYVLVAGVACQTLISPVAGRLADRLPSRLVVITGMVLSALGLLAFSFLSDGTPYWYIVSTLCVLGLGFGLFASPIAHMVMGSVDKYYVGTASATLAATRVAGQGFSMGIASLILALVVGRHEIDKTSPTDLANLLTSVNISFAIFTGMCVLGLLTVLMARHNATSPEAPRGTNSST